MKFVLSVNNGVLSITFGLNKKRKRKLLHLNSKHFRICDLKKCTSNRDSKSPKNQHAFSGSIVSKHRRALNSNSNAMTSVASNCNFQATWLAGWFYKLQFSPPRLSYWIWFPLTTLSPTDSSNLFPSLFELTAMAHFLLIMFRVFELNPSRRGSSWCHLLDEGRISKERSGRCWIIHLAWW